MTKKWYKVTRSNDYAVYASRSYNTSGKWLRVKGRIIMCRRG